MAMYDVGSMQSSMKAVMSHTSQFYPIEGYKELGLKEILALSDECIFSDDEDEPVDSYARVAVAPSSASPAPMMVISDYSNAGVCCDELEWSQLEDPSLMETGTDDIPVAAALVSSMEMPVIPENNRSKRSTDSFLTYEDEEESSQCCPNGEDEDRRFRPYQEGQWFEKFEELCKYRKENGNCLVPHTYKENLPLARWVKRQRYQYKLMKDGKPSTMTDERAQALADIEFVWDSQAAAWGERLAELQLYRSRFMHCNVPSNYSENPQLATWVKCQRRQYKLFMEGKPSNMTKQRIQELGNLGFEWELRSYKKQRVE